MLDQARELQIEKRIVSLGWLSGTELQKAYASAALVVVPSLSFDSFPTVNLEAMAAGKPVVATCFGGSREAVQDGVTGYIVNPFNVPVLAEKIVDLLQSVEKLNRFGHEGHERVLKEFTLEKQALEFEKYYQHS